MRKQGSFSHFPFDHIAHMVWITCYSEFHSHKECICLKYSLHRSEFSRYLQHLIWVHKARHVLLGHHLCSYIWLNQVSWLWGWIMIGSNIYICIYKNLILTWSRRHIHIYKLHENIVSTLFSYIYVSSQHTILVSEATACVRIPVSSWRHI